VRFIAANLHPDHDTIAVFQRSNKAAFEAAFLQVLPLTRESGLLRLPLQCFGRPLTMAARERGQALTRNRHI
jgi:hypothetical protein